MLASAHLQQMLAHNPVVGYEVAGLDLSIPHLAGPKVGSVHHLDLLVVC